MIQKLNLCILVQVTISFVIIMSTLTSTSLCKYNVPYRIFNDGDFQIQLFSNNNASYIRQNNVYV